MSAVRCQPSLIRFSCALFRPVIAENTNPNSAQNQQLICLVPDFALFSANTAKKNFRSNSICFSAVRCLPHVNRLLSINCCSSINVRDPMPVSTKKIFFSFFFTFFSFLYLTIVFFVWYGCTLTKGQPPKPQPCKVVAGASGMRPGAAP